MATRRKIGLIYRYNENWIGGTYYIENLIAALNLLPDIRKVTLIIFTDDIEQFFALKKKCPYPYLFHRRLFIRLSKPKMYINRISLKIFKISFFKTFHLDIDLLFPGSNEYWFKKNQKYLYWIPDFQEHFLPHFFSSEDIKERKEYQLKIIESAENIVFSSMTVKNEFNQIYPSNLLKQFVLPFAVTHQNISISKNILDKYELPNDFFICNNQFWEHKNHSIILRAVARLKQNGNNAFIVFTGKNHDYRNPTYFNDLTYLAKELNVETNLKYLGFIDRTDQLYLMEKAIAVIQPSLCEGWSTVLEDAKLLAADIIASSIAVHKEQLNEYSNKLFFNPLDEEELSNCMMRIQKNCAGIKCFDYKKSVIKFGEKFINITDEILTG